MAEKYNAATKKIFLHIEQMQSGLFEFPLEISCMNGSEKSTRTISMKDKITEEEFSVSFIPTEIKIDPEVNLLFKMIGLEKIACLMMSKVYVVLNKQKQY